MAAMRVAQNRERHEARVEALQTRESDKALDCVGDGSFRIAKQTISLVREITPLVTPDLRAKVHYTGWVAPVPSDGAAPLIDDALVKQATRARPFDSSRGRQPFSFVVGHTIEGLVALARLQRLDARLVALAALRDAHRR